MDSGMFEKRYIDPLDLNYLKSFQRGIDEMHGKEAIVTKVAENIAVLEQVAVAMFQLISHQVHGTDLNIKVNPYNMSLNEAYSEADHIDFIDGSEAVKTDVEKMWFYQKELVV